MSDNQENDAITQARIDSQTEYDRIEEAAFDADTASDEETADEAQRLVEEQYARDNQHSIDTYGMSLEERLAEFQDPMQQAIQDFLNKPRYTIPTQEVLDEARVPTVDDEEE